MLLRGLYSHRLLNDLVVSNEQMTLFTVASKIVTINSCHQWMSPSIQVFNFYDGKLGIEFNCQPDCLFY